MSEELILFSRTLDLLDWLLPKAETFPKIYRTTVVQRLLDAAFAKPVASGAKSHPMVTIPVTGYAGPNDPGGATMSNRAHVLLWTDSTAAYLDAVKAAGLADRVEIETLPRKEQPSEAQLARTEALMAAANSNAEAVSLLIERGDDEVPRGPERWLRTRR